MGRAKSDAQSSVGQTVDDLSLEQRIRLAGKYIAREIYAPETIPLRRIEAIGDSVEDCAKMLRQRGLDPKRFEYVRLRPPY